MKQDYRTKHKWTIDGPDATPQNRHLPGRQKNRKIRWIALIVFLILLVIGAYIGKSQYHKNTAHRAKKVPKTTEIQLVLPQSNQ